jgi:acetyl esterase/lipase
MRRAPRVHTIVLLSFVALTGNRATAAEDKQKPFARQEDVVYGETHGVGLLMDVFTPTGMRNGVGVVDVVSGAWHSDRGKLRDHERAGIYDVLCARGYTVFGIRPGSVTKYTGNEMLAHIKLGIRFVKAHAAQYGINPDRLGLTGASAGAHLACLTAVTAEDGYANSKSPLNRFSTRVRAAAVFFPPTDFLDYGGREPNLKLIGRLFFSGGVTNQSDEDVKEQARLLSPARQVTADAPPFLFIHGDADPMVPLQQSETMIAALKQAGVSAELVVKKGGGHPWPTIREEVVVLADWFDAHLLRQRDRKAPTTQNATSRKATDVAGS